MGQENLYFTCTFPMMMMVTAGTVSSCRYTEDRPILDGATLEVPTGKSVAIVGSSGSGGSPALNFSQMS